MWKDYSNEEQEQTGKCNYPYRYHVYIAIGCWVGAIISLINNFVLYEVQRTGIRGAEH